MQKKRRMKRVSILKRIKEERKHYRILDIVADIREKKIIIPQLFDEFKNISSKLRRLKVEKIRKIDFVRLCIYAWYAAELLEFVAKKNREEYVREILKNIPLFEKMRKATKGRYNFFAELGIASAVLALGKLGRIEEMLKLCEDYKGMLIVKAFAKSLRYNLKPARNVVKGILERLEREKGLERVNVEVWAIIFYGFALRSSAKLSKEDKGILERLKKTIYRREAEMVERIIKNKFSEREKEFWDYFFLLHYGEF